MPDFSNPAVFLPRSAWEKKDRTPLQGGLRPMGAFPALKRRAKSFRPFGACKATSQELVEESIHLQRVRPPTESGLVGSHPAPVSRGPGKMDSMSFSRNWCRDRTLPPPITALSRVGENNPRRHPDAKSLSLNRWRWPSEMLLRN